MDKSTIKINYPDYKKIVVTIQKLPLAPMGVLATGSAVV
jgi:hypothetical protein